MKFGMYRIAIIVALTIIWFHSKSQTTIRMQKKNGVYIVPCKVNDLKLKFIFDTGASEISISLTEALFMLKNGYLSQEDILGKQYFTDATGDISVGTKIILKKIEFAGNVIYNVEASVVNTISAPLLLGQSAMAKLGKFQFNPSNGTLIILNGNESSTPIIQSGQTAESYYNQAVAKYDLNDYNGTILLITKTIELNPKHSESYFIRASCKRKLEDYRGAITDFNKVIELNPSNSQAYMLRGGSFGILNEQKLALNDFNKAIELNSNYSDAYLFRGMTKFSLGDKDGGCLDYIKAGEIGNVKAHDMLKKYCN